MFVSTFFQSKEWLLDEESEPYNGWYMADILKVRNSGAVNDVYGKLFRMLEVLLVDVKHRLVANGAAFEMHNMDTAQLPNVLAPSTFARIEVCLHDSISDRMALLTFPKTGNYADSNLLGVSRTVHFLAPLLQDHDTNRHATLLTHFKMAVLDVFMSDTENCSVDMRLADQYGKVITRSLGSDALEPTLQTRLFTMSTDGPSNFAKYVVLPRCGVAL